MGKGKGGLPDRWLDYIAVGKPIKGVPIIACKVPLKEELLRFKLDMCDWFTPDMLIEKVPNVGCIVDLTATNRYYNPIVFTERGIRHEKIFCAGHVIPNATTVQRFFQVLDDFLHNIHSQGKFLMVHCTHGLNRTGYLVSRYMVERRGFQPADAIAAFNEARGHTIERPNYLEHLREMSQQVCLNPVPLFQPREPAAEGASFSPAVFNQPPPCYPPPNTERRNTTASIERPPESNWRQRAALASQDPEASYRPYQYSSSVNQLVQRSHQPLPARNVSNHNQRRQIPGLMDFSYPPPGYGDRSHYQPPNPPAAVYGNYRSDPRSAAPPSMHQERVYEPPQHSYRFDNRSWQRPSDRSDHSHRPRNDRSAQSRPPRSADYNGRAAPRDQPPRSHYSSTNRDRVDRPRGSEVDSSRGGSTRVPTDVSKPSGPTGGRKKTHNKSDKK